MLSSKPIRSISEHLLWRLLVSLVVLSAIATVLAYNLAAYYSNRQFDRYLLNSEDSVVTRLDEKNGNLVVELPPQVESIMRHNNRDEFYYEIFSEDKKRLVGNANLNLPAWSEVPAHPLFSDGTLNGKAIRSVVVKARLPNEREEQVFVAVAETLNARQQFLHSILLSILAPQLLLIVLGALAVWSGVRSGLRPLNQLMKALQARSEFDLTPVAVGGQPFEVVPLIDEINSLLSRVEGHIQSQQRFVANAAHQLRTPVAGLRTFIEYGSRLEADQRVKQVFQQLNQGTNRIAHLVNRLLVLARAERNARTPTHTPVDINFVASEVASNFVHLAMKKNIDLDFRSSMNPSLVMGDAGELHELISNLVDNAVRYTPEGGVIVVGVRNENGNGIKLSVSDNGPGIPAEERERVFERFYRVLDSNSGVEGSGLGLAIVHEIARSHEGHVAVSEGPNGSGTVVTVTFPSAR